jgi:hypothetical protein
MRMGELGLPRDLTKAEKAHLASLAKAGHPLIQEMRAAQKEFQSRMWG